MEEGSSSLSTMAGGIRLKINLSPPLNPDLCFPRLAHRGRRRSRRWMTELGAGADNASAVEPREAQRPTSLAARTPSAAIPGDGDIAVGARPTANGLPGGPASLACHVGAVAQLPGASRRSIPSLRG